MFFHKKELIEKEVKIDEPILVLLELFLEQFGGATGELSAALQYWVQSFHTEDTEVLDMLQDIATEEFSHLEMIGRLIEVSYSIMWIKLKHLKVLYLQYAVKAHFSRFSRFGLDCRLI